MENYYEVLGVSENATQEEIKKTFRSKSKELHPDRGGNEEEFKKINEAYSVIGDEQKRAQYDNQRNNPFGGGFGDGFGENPFDIFSSMFGQKTQRKAPDRIMDVRIGAVDSFLGKQVQINFTRKINCDTCKGKGGERQTCQTCSGTGRITQRVGNAFFQNIIQTQCNSCGGNGFTFKSLCNVCSGEGKLNENQSVTINTPVGISDGQLIKAQSLGDYHEGMFGDIICKVHVVEQDGFEKSEIGRAHV